MRCAPLAALAVGLIAAAYVSIAHADDARTEVGIANTGEIHARDIIVKYGLTEPEVRALFLALQKEEGAQVNKVTELATRLAVTSEAVRNFFRILQEQQVKEEDLLPKLAEIAGSHLDLLARPKILEPDEDPAVAAAITEARSAVDRGDYEAADRLLSQAENLELAAANVALELERQAQAAKERHLTRAAAKRGERGELAPPHPATSYILVQSPIFSNVAPARMMVGSSKKRPHRPSPIGKPSSMPQGMLATGCPLTSNWTVLAIMLSAAAKYSPGGQSGAGSGVARKVTAGKAIRS